MRRIIRDGNLMPLVLGISDGVLNALALSAGRLINRTENVSAALAGKIALVSLVSGAFVFFVSNYHQLRAELIHAETQLNLTSHGAFAASRLGAAVVRETLWATAIASGSGFLGALIPLLIGALLPELRWVAIAASLASLGILGLALARSVHGTYWRWGLGLLSGGILVFFIGVKLRIVS